MIGPRCLGFVFLIVRVLIENKLSPVDDIDLRMPQISIHFCIIVFCIGVGCDLVLIFATLCYCSYIVYIDKIRQKRLPVPGQGGRTATISGRIRKIAADINWQAGWSLPASVAPKAVGISDGFTFFIQSSRSVPKTGVVLQCLA